MFAGLGAAVLVAGCLTATKEHRYQYAEGTTAGYVYLGVPDHQRETCLRNISVEGVFGDGVIASRQMRSRYGECMQSAGGSLDDAATSAKARQLFSR